MATKAAPGSAARRRGGRYAGRRAAWRLAMAFASLLAASPIVACAAGRDKPQPKLPTAILRSGGVSVVAELARTADEQAMGFMFRKELADGEGMLFVYDSDRRMTFWMKNTLVPLSIAFLGADGTIREIRDMEPLSEALVESTRYARHALEVPRGWFERVGLGVGDRFELPPGL